MFKINNIKFDVDANDMLLDWIIKGFKRNESLKKSLKTLQIIPIQFNPQKLLESLSKEKFTTRVIFGFYS